MAGIFLLVVLLAVVGAVFAVNFTKGRSETPILTLPVSPETGKVIEGHYNVLGKPFECTVCGHTEFAQRSAQLNTAGMTFMKLDWANESARCLVCKSCAYVHWFVA
jgi:predicted nucleic-acid-binding Zn-ribbon protein